MESEIKDPQLEETIEGVKYAKYAALTSAELAGLASSLSRLEDVPEMVVTATLQMDAGEVFVWRDDLDLLVVGVISDHYER